MRASFSSLHSVFFFRNGGETRGRDRTPPDRSSAGPANQRLGEKYLPAVEPREVRRRVSASERPKPLASASARPPGRDPAPGVSIAGRVGGKVWASELGLATNQRLGEKYLHAVEPREVRRRVSTVERLVVGKSRTCRRGALVSRRIAGRVHHLLFIGGCNFYTTEAHIRTNASNGRFYLVEVSAVVEYGLATESRSDFARRDSD